jgi:hypothetical protein
VNTEAALQALEGITVEPVRPGALAAFGIFDWGEWRDELSQSIGSLLAASAGAPVQTAVAVTYTGWQSRFETVWRADIDAVAAAPHWAAVDAQNTRRLQVLRAIAGVVRIATEIATVASAGWNPLGAINAARKLIGSIGDFLNSVGDAYQRG